MRNQNIVLLDTLTFGQDANLTAFDAFGTVTNYLTTSLDQTLERIQTADIIVTNKVVITKEMMQKSTQLKLICVAATGMNNVDLDAAKSLGIEVRNVSGYSTNSVVQLTFSMLFYLINQSRYYDSFVQSGAWSKSELFTHVGEPFFELSGKTWGIIGMGTIGQEVAKIATAFGANVHYYSTSGKNTLDTYDRVPLDQLMKTSDIISIHAPLNENTHNLITKENLPFLKPKAVLLNLGRGGIVNEDDICTALQTHDIYVGLDVLSKEPIDINHPLFAVKSSHLYITPHIAWTSIEARKALIEGVINSIRELSPRASKILT